MKKDIKLKINGDIYNLTVDTRMTLLEAIREKIVTYDFARLMEGAHEVKCSDFGRAVAERIGR